MGASCLPRCQAEAEEPYPVVSIGVYSRKTDREWNTKCLRSHKILIFCIFIFSEFSNIFGIIGVQSIVHLNSNHPLERAENTNKTYLFLFLFDLVWTKNRTMVVKICFYKPAPFLNIPHITLIQENFLINPLYKIVNYPLMNICCPASLF